MRKISIVVPCYNEERNIPELYNQITNLMNTELSCYTYEILFIDNKSKDNSRALIRDICRKDERVKAIFNLVNCGPDTNSFFGLRESDGDCSVLLYADFQEPLEMIPAMVAQWEKGEKVVCMVKTKSKENKFVYFCREIYYRIFKTISRVEQIRQFTGFGLYDRSFVEVLRTLHDATPFTKGIVAEYAPDHIEIPYEQQRRKEGKSSLNFFGYYNSAMLSFTTYTKTGLRLGVFIGSILTAVSFVVGLVYLIGKLIFWNTFTANHALVIWAALFLYGLQMLMIGILGEYVMSINIRTIDRPMAVVEERINFKQKPGTMEKGVSDGEGITNA